MKKGKNFGKNERNFNTNLNQNQYQSQSQRQSSNAEPIQQQTKKNTVRINNKPTKKKNEISAITKLLLFPGEEYDFNEKLIRYNGFGYSTTSNRLVAKRCSLLLCDKNTRNIIDDPSEEVYRSVGKYYSPIVDDFVIGTIVQKSSEFYKVDINTYTYAILSSNNFEGATKKTKPNIHLGDLIFARVLKVNNFDAPVLSCISEFENKNWASGESFFGALKGGNLFQFPKIHSWDFYKDNYALERLKDVVSNEIAISNNGKIWINSDTPQNIFNIYKILMASLESSKDEIEKMIHEIFLEKMRVD